MLFNYIVEAILCAACIVLTLEFKKLIKVIIREEKRTARMMRQIAEMEKTND